MALYKKRRKTQSLPYTVHSLRIRENRKKEAYKDVPGFTDEL